MKKFGAIFVLILWLSVTCFGQSTLGDYSNTTRERKGSDHKFFYGSALALTFSAPIFFSVSPTVGYEVSKYYNVGLAIPFIHMNNFGAKSNLFGIRYFNQFILFKGVMIHAEYEAMNYPRKWTDPTVNNKSRSWEHSFNVGIGYRQYFNFNQTAFVDLYLLYNTKWKSVGGIYTSPFVLRTLIAFK